jgi:shikimate kinase / 3-dehydroquinate synthase
MMIVVLIGMPGVGKTSVAARLADAVGATHADLDHMIEAETGQSISQLFERFGEPAFREREAAALRAIVASYGQAASARVVLSVGGGALMNEQSREMLKSQAKCVYLRSSLSTLLTRLSEDGKRPLLRGNNVRKKVEQLLRVRTAQYEFAASTVVDTDDLSVAAVSSLLVPTVREWFESAR